MIRRAFLTLAALCALSGASVAQAGIITTGNSHPVFPDVSAYINFAVVERTGASWSATLPGLGSFTAGTGSAALDDTATYLYLFQIVNEGAPISTVKTTVDGSAVSSFGHFGTTGFFESLVAISSTNPTIGTPGTAGNPGMANIYTDLATINTVTVGAISGTTTVAPNSVFLAGNVLNWQFVYPSVSGSGFDAGDRSVLIGYTSNTKPVFGTMGITDGETANGQIPRARNEPGDIPFPVMPEPTSMIVWALGAGLVGTVGYFKRRRTVA